MLNDEVSGLPISFGCEYFASWEVFDLVDLAIRALAKGFDNLVFSIWLGGSENLACFIIFVWNFLHGLFVEWYKLKFENNY